MTRINTCRRILGAALLVLGAQALADEATIRKNLTERVPNFPAIEEIGKSPMPGLWELRVNGVEIYYTDAEANFILQGNLIDTKLKRNLTEERIEKLSMVEFDALPYKDSFTVVRGNGKRKLVVFEDPNCGYCKRFERDMQKVDNVTVHVFLIPILGPDSAEKSKNIWCAKDKAKAWLDWVVRDQVPSALSCDTAALARNVEVARKYKITGTPTLVFADGSRVPGAVAAQQVDKLLAERVPRSKN